MICNLFLFIFTFLYTFTTSERVDYTILYDFKYITDPEAQTYSSDEEYMLYKIGPTSHYINSNAHYNDSVIIDFRKGKDPRADPQAYADLLIRTVSGKIKKLKSDLTSVKDFKNKIATIVLYDSYRRVYMEVPLQLNWQIHQESQQIAGLPCIKATTHYGGRDYTAWFTTQIPISDGPYIFNGLPGLILKVTDSDNWYKFEVKSINLKPTKRHIVNMVADDFPQKIDRKTYIKRSTDEKDNPKIMYGFPNPTPEMKMNLREERKTRFDLLIEQ